MLQKTYKVSKRSKGQIVASVAKKWRQEKWRGYIRKHKDNPSMLAEPPEGYNLSKTESKEFVAVRLSPTWQVCFYMLSTFNLIIVVTIFRHLCIGAQEKISKY